MEDKDDKVEAPLYHERQVKELCALHVLNNLFQKKQTFTKKDLDDICNRLSPDYFINPHRSMLGMGNYDVNVLMAALLEKGYETIWFDKRKDVDVLLMENIMGLILNIPSEYRLGFIKLPIHRKHWIAIRFLGGQYMNLDSKLDGPKPIGDEASLIEFLRKELSDGDKELFLVVEPQVSEKALWKKISIDYSSTSPDSDSKPPTAENVDDKSDDKEETSGPHGKDGPKVKGVQNGLENIDLCDKPAEKSTLDDKDVEQEQSLQSENEVKDKNTKDLQESQVTS